VCVSGRRGAERSERSEDGTPSGDSTRKTFAAWSPSLAVRTTTAPVSSPTILPAPPLGAVFNSQRAAKQEAVDRVFKRLQDPSEWWSENQEES
jgi:hypothetical protein